ncbi:MAG: sporulation protein [Methanobrevibacter sp.]|nr:sporulation protein [Methanobrevibacter sp.]
MVKNNVPIIVEELQKLLAIENFIGEPIETDDKLIIPVMRVGFGFGTGQNVLVKENSNIVGAGAGAEPVSMVVIPKNESAEGIRVLNLTGGSEVNKALNDIGLMVTDLVNEFIIKRRKEEEYDEAEFIEPATKNVDVDKSS